MCTVTDIAVQSTNADYPDIDDPSQQDRTDDDRDNRSFANTYAKPILIATIIGGILLVGVVTTIAGMYLDKSIHSKTI